MSNQEIEDYIAKIVKYRKEFQHIDAESLSMEVLKQLNQENHSDYLGQIYYNLGIIQYNKLDYVAAKSNYELSLTYFQRINKLLGVSANLTNIGLVFNRLSDYETALEYFKEALEITEKIDNQSAKAVNLNNIGLVFEFLKKFDLSLEYYYKAFDIDLKIDNKIGQARNLTNIASIYSQTSRYEKSLDNYQNAILIYKEIDDQYGIHLNYGNIASVYHNTLEFDKALEYYTLSLSYFEQINDIHKVARKYGQIGSLNRDINETEKALEFLLQSLSLSRSIQDQSMESEVLEELYLLHEKLKQFDLALKYLKESVAMKNTIHSEKSKNKALLFDQKRKLEEDEKARQLKLARFQEQEKILHDILPIQIADRILLQETFIADHFESASVLFMDLVGFTTLASIAPPKQLVYFLDAFFQKADKVVENYGLEKIKTIGDGYLAVANVTTQLEEHQKATALAALQLLETMKDYEVNIPTNLGDTNWIKDMNDIEIRIGIHTGEVVAGIIGKNKYTYDLWGDAVNIASRMESNSEPGRIHISESFSNSLSHYSEFNIIPRGTISIKGKGTMNTYWLERAV